MGGLTGVVGNNLNCIFKRAEIRFGSAVKDGQSLGCGKNRMELLAGGCEIEHVGNGRARLKNMEDELVCQVFDQHCNGLL